MGGAGWVRSWRGWVHAVSRNSGPSLAEYQNQGSKAFRSWQIHLILRVHFSKTLRIGRHKKLAETRAPGKVPWLQQLPR